ncbi:MAG: hypothetical protein AAF663_00395 [Planctomycetota bacterium]
MVAFNCKPAFTVTLRDEPRQADDRPVEIRLRIALKRLLRDHGLRCVTIAPLNDGDTVRIDQTTNARADDPTAQENA